MLTGKRFQIQRPTLSVAMEEGKRQAVTIPAGSIIKVVEGPRELDDDHGMIDVLLNGRILTMFAVDVDVRGTEILDDKTAKV